MSQKKKCQNASCCLEGLYKAPKTKKAHIKHEQDWIWLCKQHVREYNSKWDYYEGMDADEIYQSWKQGITWDRPTFHSSLLNYKSKFLNDIRFDTNNKLEFMMQKNGSTREQYSFDPKVRKALSYFNLSPLHTKQELYLIYRRMVKQYHLDHNSGSHEAAEKLKKTIQHFKVLEQKGY